MEMRGRCDVSLQEDKIRQNFPVHHARNDEREEACERDHGRTSRRTECAVANVPAADARATPHDGGIVSRTSDAGDSSAYQRRDASRTTVNSAPREVRTR